MISKSKKIIFESKSFNPFFNLAFENWLIQDHFKSATSPDCLFIYRNSPSIIIGRNQNIWVECDVNEAQRQGIPILRRYSGGGTVYHDLGNVNYSLHRSKEIFNRTHGAEMIISALKEHNSDLFLSPRHDIFMKSNLGNWKVSGSAYKLSKERAYHHGTLLLSTDLSRIDKLLKSNLEIVCDGNSSLKFGGVSSVPSPVANIPNLSFEKCFNLICKEFKVVDNEFISISEDLNSVDNLLSFNDKERIKIYKNELESWNWTFSKSPPFKIYVKGINSISEARSTITIESGVIVECDHNKELIGIPFNNDIS